MHMKTNLFRIIKLGGSLLTRSDWPSNLITWVEKQVPMRNIFLVGGGLPADAVRAFDKAHQLRPSISHTLAIEALGLSLRMAEAVLPHADIITSLDDLATESKSDQIELLDVRPFLSSVESSKPGERLPHDWSATSDSIAARIASVYGAAELVLLKSTLPAHCNDWENATQSGLVDEHFPYAVKKVSNAYCVNLTDPQAVAWRPSTEQKVQPCDG